MVDNKQIETKDSVLGYEQIPPNYLGMGDGPMIYKGEAK